MGIASRLKELHADNIGKSTLLIVAAVFTGLTWFIYQTIETIVDRPDSAVQVVPAAAAESASPSSAPASPAADSRN
jgi:hypothetical protein